METAKFEERDAQFERHVIKIWMELPKICKSVDCRFLPRSCGFIVRSEITHPIFFDFDQAAERRTYDDEFDG